MDHNKEREKNTNIKLDTEEKDHSDIKHEIIIENDDEILFSSGFLTDNAQNLYYEDDDFLLFKSYLLDDNKGGLGQNRHCQDLQ